MSLSSGRAVSLNLGCGKNYKTGFINVDLDQRFKVDLRIDLSKDWPFHSSSCRLIYAEHFIEHLDYVSGVKLLANCYSALKDNGKLRLVLPDFSRIFSAYVNNDQEFFAPFFDSLNNSDFIYYKSCLTDPMSIKEQSTDIPRPSWHFSNRQEDIEQLTLRARFYKHPIEIVDWFVHQYGEHKTLYDFLSLKNLLESLGFSGIALSEFNSTIDSRDYYTNSCLYVQAKKQ